jgi:hypothetical protein
MISPKQLNKQLATNFPANTGTQTSSAVKFRRAWLHRMTLVKLGTPSRHPFGLRWNSLSWIVASLAKQTPPAPLIGALSSSLHSRFASGAQLIGRSLCCFSSILSDVFDFGQACYIQMDVSIMDYAGAVSLGLLRWQMPSAPSIGALPVVPSFRGSLQGSIDRSITFAVSVQDVDRAAMSRI